MTRFLVRTTGVKPLIAIAAAHGLTDLDSTTWVTPYGILLLLPLPSPVVTGLFCVSSVLHFAEDVSIYGSVALHGAVATLGSLRGTQAAFRAMFIYLCFCHVPMHFSRCYLRGRWRATVFTIVVTILSTAPSSRMHEWVPLTDGMQRIATAHIITELGVMLGAM